MTASTHRVCGFCLVDLMISIAVGSILLLAAADMLVSYGKGYERIGGGAASEREARALIAQLAADLSTARFHKDGVFDQSTGKWPASRLGFLSLQPARAQSNAGCIGDLCAVHYYIKDLSVGGKSVRCLMRGCRESQETFKALETDKVASLFMERTRLDEPIACGVVAFNARPLSRDLSGKWIEWVANGQGGPDALRVDLVIARRELAGKLKQPGDWDGLGAGAELLGEPAAVARNPDLEVYGTLIRFGSHENPGISIP
jgi:Tfp pilus assembly protein PilE